MIGFSDAMKPIILIAVLVMAFFFFLSLPVVVEYIQEADLTQIRLPEEQPPSAVDPRPPDMRKYFELKNLSCGILSGNFLLQTKDISRSRVSGLLSSVSGEREIAESIASQYDSEQTTSTYVRGTWMKKIILSPSANHTTIWKEGRIYQCNPSCTMNLLGDEGWQAHLDELERIRTSCLYFGKTDMPEEVDIIRLISIEMLGREDSGSFRCERFRITGNRTYAEELLVSNITMDNDQRALLWGISHLKGPMEECLDDGVGLIVWRNLTIDLTESYRFDYEEDGGMFVDQYTELLYYDDSVPESFFALPS